jgi:hypothetical protein
MTITNARKDELRVKAKLYVRRLRLEFKKAQLGDRANGKNYTARTEEEAGSSVSGIESGTSG